MVTHSSLALRIFLPPLLLWSLNPGWMEFNGLLLNEGASIMRVERCIRILSALVPLCSVSCGYRGCLVDVPFRLLGDSHTISVCDQSW